MDIMDISIATIEAIENAAKYGDGKSVFIKTEEIAQFLSYYFFHFIIRHKGLF
jgi:anti-sigma regulatory factor (Ser/Thr protein kinase)